MKINTLLGATALAGSLALAPAAMAQDGPGAPLTNPNPVSPADPTTTQEELQEAGSEIIVTGSRLARPNIDTAVPITALTGAQLQAVGQVSLGETLNRLPALRSTLSQANSTATIGTAGLSLLDLRGLGTARTLVLVNGRRHVSATPGSFQVDVNTIPNDLIERVEVVTGGNSGTYGSDAVSGVVNFVLKQNFEGFEGRVQGGVSSRGDRGSFLGSAIYGKNFSEGRGNITLAVEYAQQEQLLFNQRNEQTGAFTGVPGFFQTTQTTFRNPDGTARNEPPEGNGIIDTSYFGVNPGNKFGIISLGGTVNTVCPAVTATSSAAVRAQAAAVCTGQLSPIGQRLSRNYVFQPDGTLVRDQPALDLRNVGGGIFGGYTASGVEGAMLLPGLERINVNLMSHFDVSDAFKPFIEAKYVHVTANQTSTQPTFVNGTLSPTFYLDNPYLTAQARDTIRTLQGYAPGTAAYDAGTFTFFRFNNDIGTRAEDHKRDTYRVVAGFRGDLTDVGNWKYEASFNYGRTETYYETGGNVDIAKFNRAANAVRNSAGEIVCRVNADAITTNDDPACRPLNLFGQGAPMTTPDGVNYVLHTSSRVQWAEQINALYYVAGDTSGFFTLPGGPVQIALGAEYRREDAFSDYDDYTQTGATFLNAFAAFDPPAVNVKEVFGELRFPILRDAFVHELSVEGSGRVSDYSFLREPVYAWNAGVVFAPVPDIRFRAGIARAVRAPNLSNLYATAAQTFANNLIDPCSQTVINQNPNRARNCAAAGIPTTITLPDGSVVPWVNTPTSGISGINSGNAGLEPERSKSFTVGAVFQPRFLPGFSLTVDYYDIKIEQAIDSLSGQNVINRCYDDPVSINNPFCAVVFRRRSADGIADFTFAGQQGRRFAGFNDFNLGVTGPGFVSQPFNFARLETAGIDAEAAYNHSFNEDIRLNVRAVVSWLGKRNQYTFISNPDQYTRVKSTLGDPEWRGLFQGTLQAGPFDLQLTSQYIGKQTVDAWNVHFTEQDRPPTNADRYPFNWYPSVWLHDIQFGIRASDRYRLYFGVDNVNDQLPPYGLTGTSIAADGRTSAIFPVTGRFWYAGAKINF